MLEQGEVDGGRHVGRVTYRRVEVDDPVECSAHADPVVHRLALGLTSGGVVEGAAERRERPAEDLQSGRVRGGCLSSSHVLDSR